MAADMVATETPVPIRVRLRVVGGVATLALVVDLVERAGGRALVVVDPPGAAGGAWSMPTGPAGVVVTGLAAGAVARLVRDTRDELGASSGITVEEP
jgi:hypothetical protein